MLLVAVLLAVCRLAVAGDPYAAYGICPLGHFCPLGSGTPLPCPPGTSSAATGLHNVTQCADCLAGYFCNQSGIVTPFERCLPGFTCPGGDVVPTKQCVLGHYCDGGDATPNPCDAGSYQNQTAQPDCRECPSGFYCEEAQVHPTDCPKGYFCPLATEFGTQFACPNGTYNNFTNIEHEGECTPCLGGEYCDIDGLVMPSGLCKQGHFCTVGSNTRVPGDGGDNAYVGETCADQADAEVNGVCPRGHYCPEGSTSPSKCPPGTMNPASGMFNLSHCADCQAGYFCNQSAIVHATELCAPGFFCPGGDVVPTKQCTLGHYCAGGDYTPEPCAAGSYQNTTGRGSCKECPSGYFCEEGQITPWDCPKGYFCPPATEFGTQYACRNGTFNNFTNIEIEEECTPCTGGEYCDIDGLVLPSGYCKQGHFCTVGSNTRVPGDGGDNAYVGETCADQADAEVNGVCPRGHYCPEGSTSPSKCPPGTMNPASGMFNLSHCADCQAGYFCNQSAIVRVTELCAPGFYCPGGDIVPTKQCTLGHYCAGGDYTPEPCAAGSYQNTTGRGSCKECPSGYFCEEGQINPVDCPKGYFCPPATEFDTQYSCPNGTFNNFTNIEHEEECTPCVGGEYCETDGLMLPTGYCKQGHFCTVGSNTRVPGDGGDNAYVGETCADQAEAEVNGVCPRGHYCPEGSTSPSKCPPGTMNPASGMFNLSHCADCQAGYFCNQSAIIHATELCAPGFYCPGGDIVPTRQCTLGHYCAGGDYTPEPCAAGSYQNTTGRGSCKECPSGYFCEEGQINPTDCPRGYYCPPATEFDAQYACPNGTFNNFTNIEHEEECTPCVGGEYCETDGLMLPTGYCKQGHFCTVGSNTRVPGDGGDNAYVGETCADQAEAEVNGVCPRGHYCPEGSTAPSKCPPGTMNEASGMFNLSHCADCQAGYFCNQSAIIRATELCAPGFYCPGGDIVPTRQCSLGHYCAGGDYTPEPCAPGSYQNTTGRGSCKECPPGFYCVEGQITPWDCPKGHYCPAATNFGIEFACPNGTYSNRTNRESIEECTQCTPGEYCETEGLTLPTGPCLAGFFCSLGSRTSTPGDEEAELYLGETCVDQTEAEVNGVCPMGHYCPEGSRAPKQCPPGRVSTARGNQNVTDCSQCRAGYFCPESGQVNSTELCASGFYCPAGTAVPSLVCTVGHFCAGGDPVPLACAAGTYTNTTAQSACQICPSGFFCEEGTVTPEPCPTGHFCTAGTKFGFERPCLNGTYSNVTQLQAASECELCSPGQYCATKGLTIPTGKCDIGFYCGPGSSTATPGGTVPYNGETCVDQSGETSGVCPLGHYCPLGTGAPEQCPPGTQSSALGMWNVTQCVDCLAGYFCNQSAVIVPNEKCLPGFYCPGGDIVPTVDCRRGHFCAGFNAVPVACEPGTYQNDTGQELCRGCPSGFYCPEGTQAPLECPLGHYCPLGTKFAIEYKCPNGTFSNVTGLESAVECTRCSAGLYCSKEGLREPEGPCDAGHYCGLGAKTRVPGYNGSMYSGETCNDASDASTNGVCPFGHYCPQGSRAPVQCPRGTQSSAWGLHNATECTPCSPGFYCGGTGLVAAVTPCEATFYCPGGDMDSTLTCTIGHYCPGGDELPIACPAGRYAAVEGLAICDLCPAGFYCDETGTTVPPACPAGYYCPDGTSFATEFPCEPGTFSSTPGLTEADDCLDCPAGTYCASYGLTAPEGRCGAASYCELGAVEPEPVAGPTGGPCGAGFVCLQAAKVATPDGTDSSGYPCPLGHYCPEGSSAELSCAPGMYQSSMAKGFCVECPSGFKCQQGGTITPQICPLGRYCGGGDVDGLICTNGTYGKENGLERADQCAQCPAGEYCLDGNVTGLCSAGYYCRTGAGTPTPNRATTADRKINYLESFWAFFDSAQCPPGHYCPLGTIDPFLCPNATVRNWTHGASVDDCTPCPAGFECIPGDPVPVPCPRGFYSPRGEVPIACPRFTYNSQLAAHSEYQCLNCPAGYFCDDIAVAYYDQWPCSQGHYCVERAEEELPCPAGSYNALLSQTKLSQCLDCPRGYFCGGLATVTPSYCADQANQVGYYCPLNSANMTVCPPGFYCPQTGPITEYFGNSSFANGGTGDPILCPAGYYCPQGSLQPTKCINGTFCPLGSDFFRLCPLGFNGVTPDSNNTLTSVGDACTECPPGTYGTDSLRLKCEQCPPGYVCLGGTPTATPTDRVLDKGYVCPAGAFCPEGSGLETLCDAGSANSLIQQANASACLECKSDTYQGLAGQALCKECSSTSEAADSGNTKCSCVGLNRAFQTSGLCPCEPGFEWYDTATFKSETGNGLADCQPVVYERCTEEEERDHTGLCLAEDDDCIGQCANGGGLDVNSGMCVCFGMALLDETCDEACRNGADTLSFDPISGSFVLRKSADQNDTYFALDEIDGFEGSVDCNVGDSTCTVYSMSATTGSLSGNYGAGETINTIARRRRLQEQDAYFEGLNETLEESSQRTLGLLLDEEEHHRRLDESSASVESPVVCLEVGDTVLFDVTNEAYPKYLVESLLNTNENFDYSGFTDLGEAAQSSTTVSAFSFTFTVAGLYVFETSMNTGRISLFKVMEIGTECSTKGTFSPMTESNLNVVSAKLATDLVLDPDWEVLGGLLVGLCLVVFGLVAAMYWFRKKAWATTTGKSRKLKKNYRGKAKNVDLDAKATRTSVVRRGLSVEGDADYAVEDALFERGATANDEDDLDEEELSRQLQRHHDLVEQEFFGQRELVQQLHEAVTHEADELKKLLAVSLADARGSASKNNKLAEALRMILASCTARRLRDGVSEAAEGEAFRLIDALDRSLAEGGDRVSRRAVEEVGQAAKLMTPNEESSSETLRRLRSDLLALSLVVDTELVSGAEAEARRREVQIKSFAEFAQGLAIPVAISEQLNATNKADDDSDVAGRALGEVLRSFSGRIHHFASALQDVEQDLLRQLQPAYSTSVMEEIKLAAVAKFAELTSQLGAALMQLFSDKKARAKASGLRTAAEEDRVELERLVRALLKQTTDDENTKESEALITLSDQLKTVLEKLEGMPEKDALKQQLRTLADSMGNEEDRAALTEALEMDRRTSEEHLKEPSAAMRPTLSTFGSSLLSSSQRLLIAVDANSDELLKERHEQEWKELEAKHAALVTDDDDNSEGSDLESETSEAGGTPRVFTVMSPSEALDAVAFEEEKLAKERLLAAAAVESADLRDSQLTEMEATRGRLFVEAALKRAELAANQTENRDKNNAPFEQVAAEEKRAQDLLEAEITNSELEAARELDEAQSAARDALAKKQAAGEAAQEILDQGRLRALRAVELQLDSEAQRRRLDLETKLKTRKPRKGEREALEAEIAKDQNARLQGTKDRFAESEKELAEIITMLLKEQGPEGPKLDQMLAASEIRQAANESARVEAALEAEARTKKAALAARLADRRQHATMEAASRAREAGAAEAAAAELAARAAANPEDLELALEASLAQRKAQEAAFDAEKAEADVAALDEKDAAEEAILAASLIKRAAEARSRLDDELETAQRGKHAVLKARLTRRRARAGAQLEMAQALLKNNPDDPHATAALEAAEKAASDADVALKDVAATMAERAKARDDALNEAAARLKKMGAEEQARLLGDLDREAGSRKRELEARLLRRRAEKAAAIKAAEAKAAAARERAEKDPGGELADLESKKAAAELEELKSEDLSLADEEDRRRLAAELRAREVTAKKKLAAALAAESLAKHEALVVKFNARKQQAQADLKAASDKTAAALALKNVEDGLSELEKSRLEMEKSRDDELAKEASLLQNADVDYFAQQSKDIDAEEEGALAKLPKSSSLEERISQEAAISAEFAAKRKQVALSLPEGFDPLGDAARLDSELAKEEARRRSALKARLDERRSKFGEKVTAEEFEDASAELRKQAKESREREVEELSERLKAQHEAEKQDLLRQLDGRGMEAVAASLGDTTDYNAEAQKRQEELAALQTQLKKKAMKKHEGLAERLQARRRTAELLAAAKEASAIRARKEADENPEEEILAKVAGNAEEAARKATEALRAASADLLLDQKQDLNFQRQVAEREEELFEISREFAEEQLQREKELQDALSKRKLALEREQAERAKTVKIAAEQAANLKEETKDDSSVALARAHSAASRELTAASSAADFFSISEAKLKEEFEADCRARAVSSREIQQNELGRLRYTLDFKRRAKGAALEARVKTRRDRLLNAAKATADVLEEARLSDDEEQLNKAGKEAADAVSALEQCDAQDEADEQAAAAESAAIFKVELEKSRDRLKHEDDEEDEERLLAEELRRRRQGGLDRIGAQYEAEGWKRRSELRERLEPTRRAALRDLDAAQTEAREASLRARLLKEAGGFGVAEAASAASAASGAQMKLDRLERQLEAEEDTLRVELEREQASDVVSLEAALDAEKAKRSAALSREREAERGQAQLDAALAQAQAETAAALAVRANEEADAEGTDEAKLKAAKAQERAEHAKGEAEAAEEHVIALEEEESMKKSRDDAEARKLQQVHQREFSALEKRIEASAKQKREALKERLKKRRGSGGVVTESEASEALEARSTLESSLLMERLVAIEKALTTQRTEEKDGSNADEALRRVERERAAASELEQARVMEESLRSRRLDNRELLLESMEDVEAAKMAFNDALASAQLRPGEHELAQKALDALDAKQAAEQKALLERSPEGIVRDARLGALKETQLIEKAETEELFAQLEKLAAAKRAQTDLIMSDAEAESESTRLELEANLEGAELEEMLEKHDEQTTANLEAMLAKEESATAEKMEKAMNAHASKLRASDAASEELDRLTQSEAEEAGELEKTLGKRRDAEKRKLAERLALRRRSKPAQAAVVASVLKGTASSRDLLPEEEAEMLAQLDAKLEKEEEEARLSLQEQSAETIREVATALKEPSVNDDDPEKAAEAKRVADERAAAAREQLAQLRLLHDEQQNEASAQLKGRAQAQREALELRLQKRRRRSMDDAEGEKAQKEFETKEKQTLELKLAEEQSAEEDAQREKQQAELHRVEAETRQAVKTASIEATRLAAVEAGRMEQGRSEQSLELLRRKMDADALRQKAEFDEQLYSADREQKEAFANLNRKRVASMAGEAAKVEAELLEKQSKQQSAQKSKLRARLDAKKAGLLDKKKQATEERNALAEKHKQDAEELRQKVLTKTKEQEDAAQREAANAHVWAPRVDEMLLGATNIDAVIDVLKAAMADDGITPPVVPVEDSTDAIEYVLGRRHGTESSELLASQYAERQTLLGSRLNGLLEEKAQRRAKIFSSSTERDTEFEELDNEFAQRQQDCQMAVATELGDKHLNQEAQLRRRQMAEHFRCMKELDAIPVSHRQKDAETHAVELLVLQEAMEKEKELKLEQIEADRKKAEEKARNAHSLKLAELAAEQEAALAKESDESAKLLDAEKQRHAAKLKDAENEGDLSVKDDLLKKAHEEHAKAQKAIEEQGSHKSSALKKRLELRNKEKASQAEKSLKTQLELSAVEMERQKKAALQMAELHKEHSMKESEHLQQQVNVAPEKRIATRKLWAKFKPSSVLKNIAEEKDDSDLKDKLDRIEKLAMKLDKIDQIEKLVNELQHHPAPVHAAYHDAEDPAPQSELVAIAKSDLSKNRLAKLDFGEKLIRLMGMGSSIKLEVAEALPSNDWGGNAFRNSFAYKDAKLHIHIKRLGSFGDIALVLLNAVSHIKVNPADLSDDSNPQFIAEFHRNFKLVTTELVKMEGSAPTAAPVPQMSIDTGAASNPHFAQPAIADRLKAYADAAGLKDFIARYEDQTPLQKMSSPRNESSRGGSRSGSRNTSPRAVLEDAEETVAAAEESMRSVSAAETAARDKEKVDLKRRVEMRNKKRQESNKNLTVTTKKK